MGFMSTHVVPVISEMCEQVLSRGGDDNGGETASLLRACEAELNVKGFAEHTSEV